MTQRRTPSGQGPARRPGPGTRTTSRTAVRGANRDTVVLGRAVKSRARSGSRPAAARRTSATGGARRTAAPRPRRFTGRATVLLIVLAVLALGYTYPVRVYLGQASEIARMNADIALAKARNQELAEQAAKWEDPLYQATQAKKRFFYVKPGETAFLVWNDPGGAARDAGHPVATPQAPPDRWYDTLWSSIDAADGSP